MTRSRRLPLLIVSILVNMRVATTLILAVQLFALSSAAYAVPCKRVCKPAIAACRAQGFTRRSCKRALVAACKSFHAHDCSFTVDGNGNVSQCPTDYTDCGPGKGCCASAYPFCTSDGRCSQVPDTTTTTTSSARSTSSTSTLPPGVAGSWLLEGRTNCGGGPADPTLVPGVLALIERLNDGTFMLTTGPGVQVFKAAPLFTAPPGGFSLDAHEELGTCSSSSGVSSVGVLSVMLTGVVNGPGTIDEALSCGVELFFSCQGSGTVVPGFIAPPVP